MQTDQPYSYKVPEGICRDVGSRYGSCPLGKGNRLIQGIVLGLESQSDEEVADQDLKEIAEVLDFSLFSRKSNSGWLEELRKSVFLIKSPF